MDIKQPPPFGSKMSRNRRLEWVLWIGLVLAIGWFFWSKSDNRQEKSFTEFYQALTDKNIISATVAGTKVTWETKQNDKFYTFVPADAGYSLTKELRDNGASVKVTNSSSGSIWSSVFLWFLVGFVLWRFLSTRHLGSNRFNSSDLKFTQSQARLVDTRTGLTFKDVAGIEEAKEELEEVIQFLKNPSKFQRLGAKIPKGVLLMGAPGTGKTLLAKAVAGEAGVPFFFVSGSEFVEMFVGVGAGRVRDLFRQAKKHAPCIIFIDEIDAMGRHRGTGLGHGNDEKEQTLNQLLVELDGFEANSGIILIAASNRPDILDPALLRPGRFDRHVTLPMPDVRGREAILKVHAHSIPVSDEVDFNSLAKNTPGFSGAHLAKMVNEAALNAARYDRERVTNSDFEEAKDKVLMGPARHSAIITDREKRIIAYHEAGHALVAYFLPDADPPHKVTIVPHGNTLGTTQLQAEEDAYNYTKEQLKTQIAVCLGGRCAEKRFLQVETTGGSNDFEHATKLAQVMVTQYGMSEELGCRTFGETNEQPFLGLSLTRNEGYSEETAKKIDQEIDHLFKDAVSEVESVFAQYSAKLKELAAALLEKETLNAEDLEKILGPRPK